MNAHLKAQLQDLRSTEWFREVVRELIADRPTIRSYNPTNDNTEHWKADSMRREGYDLCLMGLGYKATDLKGDD